MSMQVDNLTPLHPYKLQRGDTGRMSTVNSSRTYDFLYHNVKLYHPIYKTRENWKVYGKLSEKTIDRIKQKGTGYMLLVVQVFENIETKTRQTRHTETHVFKQHKLTGQRK